MRRLIVGFLRLAFVAAVLGIGSVVVARGSVPFVPYARAAAADIRAGGVAISDRKLSEISGCAVSVRNPGLIWVHNDSGDKARLYGIRLSDGALVVTVTLSGVDARDWEDMALHNGRLWVGDIGDNGASRKSVTLLNVAEPSVAVAKTGQQVTLKAVRSTWTYPGGARDAEALVVDPAGTPTIIDKVNGTVWAARSGGSLEAVATIGVPLITGADTIPDGSGVLVRTYPLVLRFRAAEGKAFASSWSDKPVVVPSPLLPQAEAVCAAPDGRSGYTISESRGQKVRLVPISW
jgi:hypothetical protein